MVDITIKQHKKKQVHFLRGVPYFTVRIGVTDKYVDMASIDQKRFFGYGIDLSI